MYDRHRRRGHHFSKNFHERVLLGFNEFVIAIMYLKCTLKLYAQTVDFRNHVSIVVIISLRFFIY